MKLNFKIISLLVAGFLLISIALTTASFWLLKRNQNDNIQLFKQEFLELGREYFSENSDQIFNTVEEKIKTSASSSELISSIETINPDNTWIYSISLKKYIFAPNNKDTYKLLLENNINRYVQENILNLKRTFDIDNFQEFLNDTTSNLYPIKIQLRIYPAQDIIVGYSKTFTSSKVRIEFIQRKNEQLFTTYTMFSIITVILVLLLSITIIIIFMQTIVINPLKKISSGLEQVQKGILNVKVNIKNRDELGQIANIFNKMTDDLEVSKNQLKEYSNSLEQKIEDRTVVLNSKLNELEKINKLMVDRELKMIELKKRIEELESKLNQKTS